MGLGDNHYVVYDYSLIWEFRFVWFPTFCHRSKNFLWLKKAYRGTHKITGRGFDVNVVVWHDKYEHMKYIISAI